MRHTREHQLDLDDNFYVLSDPYCWILKNRKRGKNSDTYFPTLKMLLKAWIDDCLKECDSVKEVIWKIEDLESKIDRIGLANTIADLELKRLKEIETRLQEE